MGRPVELRCVLCGSTYGHGEVEYVCPACGLDGTLDVLYDYDEAARTLTADSLAGRERSLWRYGELLPIEDGANIPGLSVGWTPLYDCPELAREYGVAKLMIKDDGRNPTGSLKDRASAVGVARALETGQTTIACASTGNAASSLSGFAAVAGLRSFIFVPESAPAAKVTQLLVYGANVVLVRGDYADAFNLATAAIYRYGWYNRNCAINPYLVEGKKTSAMELAEQTDWDVPDTVFIAVGDGCCISGLYKGFSDLKRTGLISRIPRIVGVQAEGARPIYDAFKSGAERVAFGPADTVADSISVGAPRNWAKALRAVRESGGDMAVVSDADILSAIPEMARRTGVFGEPAGSAAYAGFRQMARAGRIGRDEKVAVVVTGNGLKDIESAKKAVGAPMVSAPDLDDFNRQLERSGLQC
ncbi:MAG: threonine synthase [Synergistaceae bacterium]|nr:threonine synthase [Synergistota bacterium]NLM70958.1 threonine synthase [Synergistaceae bacterium]